MHFGLGGAIALDAAEIHSPSGAVEKLTLAFVDRIFTIEEGKGITGELWVVRESQLGTAVLSCLKTPMPAPAKAPIPTVFNN